MPVPSSTRPNPSVHVFVQVKHFFDWKLKFQKRAGHVRNILVPGPARSIYDVDQEVPRASEISTAASWKVEVTLLGVL
uniref:Uncharacterized protein n=1 Tax=Caenorhabditis japonica TaxID=281687 RepID=A0A8R1IM12_CAEJA